VRSTTNISLQNETSGDGGVGGAQKKHNAKKQTLSLSLFSLAKNKNKTDLPSLKTPLSQSIFCRGGRPINMKKILRIRLFVYLCIFFIFLFVFMNSTRWMSSSACKDSGGWGGGGGIEVGLQRTVSITTSIYISLTCSHRCTTAIHSLLLLLIHNQSIPLHSLLSLSFLFLRQPLCSSLEIL